jgi:UDP-N-acetylglucosamine 2-epimerase (non-hydrolysing)
MGINIIHVVGARPNFMKAAPVVEALAQHNGLRQRLVHTGQHYDANMSEVFFRQLGLPEPDLNLGVGSGSHAEQTAQIMLRLESVFLQERPDVVVVYGDVNSTMAAAVVCAKLLIPVAHVEAGLRSFDRTMPEEINRIITDQIADLLFTHSPEANVNLEKEGVSPAKTHLVGNVMIDTLRRILPEAEKRWPHWQERLGIEHYALVTLHRPSNVDREDMLNKLMAALEKISAQIPVIFPVHPRTRDRLKSSGNRMDTRSLMLLEPLGYLDFLALETHAALVITDSGGMQEETTYLGVPCLTVRENTERPITVRLGTNTLVGQNTKRLFEEVENILQGKGKQGSIPPLWDGRAAVRIAQILA